MDMDVSVVTREGQGLPVDAPSAAEPRGDAMTDPARWPADHGHALLVAGRFLSRNETEAQDLVQRTYELALRNIGSLRDPGRVRHWLLAIEAHEAFRVGRRLRRALTLDAGVTQIASDGASNDELLSLREAVHRLPERIRAAVVLHYMAGLTVEETAGAMGVSQNTVKTQLRIGLDKLREVLDAAS